MWTNQSAFDYLWQTVVVEHQPITGFRYRDSYGRCLIGHLLSDETLSTIRLRHLNTAAITAMLRLVEPARTELEGIEVRFLCALQDLNDRGIRQGKPRAWYADELVHIAGYMELTIPAPILVPDYPVEVSYELDGAVSG